MAPEGKELLTKISLSSNVDGLHHVSPMGKLKLVIVTHVYNPKKLDAEEDLRASEMAQCIKSFPTKPDVLSLSARFHMVERENRFIKVLL